MRLKGGDPFVFGRGGEEAEALAAAGIDFEVVPGITSAIAAPAYAGIPVTHRGVSTHFTVVTGHEDPAKAAGSVDWDALARAGGTLVILMGAGTIGEIADRLVEGGLAPTTPVAAVRNGTRADQRTVRGTLGTIAAAGVRAPSAIVVGDVAALDLTWFEARPLFGRSVVVTRAREQASELRARLGGTRRGGGRASGDHRRGDRRDPASARRLLLARVHVGERREQLLRRAGSSRSGSTHARSPGSASRRSVPARSSRSERAGSAPTSCRNALVAESLLDAFPEPAAHGERVLLARAERGRDVLPDGLTQRGYTVDVLPVYRTVPVPADPEILARVRGGGVDAITFTSSSTVDNFCDALGAAPDPQPTVVSIGPVTSDTARRRGLRVDVEADPHTIDGLVAALLDALPSK